LPGTGEGATGYTFEGREVIDFSSGIGVNSLGYSEPGWVAAITRQAVKLQHTSNLYYTQPAVELAEFLIEKTGMSKVFFANSGAEANEGAIKTARKYSNDKYGPGRHGILSLLHSFHGRTMTTITATGQEQYHKHFHPFAQGFVYGEAGNMENIKPKLTKNICAVLIELIQGEGGVNTLEKEFVQNLAAICREKDILLIVDEVQTGIGRTGTFFCLPAVRNPAGSGHIRKRIRRRPSHWCHPLLRKNSGSSGIWRPWDHLWRESGSLRRGSLHRENHG
jgi:acetylornithine aminotransferase apoenzyme (EC 2.6.1.11)